MKVIKSEVIGYCRGVSSAIEKLNEAIELGKKIDKKVYSLGQLIHNPQVVEKFKNKGVLVIEEKDALKVEPGIVVLRAHGVSDESRRLFLDNGFFIYDATCPIVLKEQDIVFQAPSNSTIVVIGGEKHPEALALQSVETSTKKLIVSKIEDIDLLPKNNNLFVVIQSTFPNGRRNDIEHSLRQFAKDNSIEIQFANELCNSNQKRRDAIADLSKKCNCIVVIGGKNSSNTRGLYNYCINRGVETYLVSSAEDIPDKLYSYSTIGLATGTSTPLFVIEEIEEKLKRGKNET